MASSSSSSWMPFHGVHQVNIGTSLRRALKARKNNGDPPPPPAAKRLPDRDFYAFRYNFKPTSIDTDRPGSIDVRKSTDSTLVTVEYPSKQKGETHVFRGSENVAKEWDCVLVYDEELGTFTLEKLESHVALTHERKPMGARPPPPAESQLSSPSKVKDDPDAQLEKDLELTEHDSELISKHVAYRQEEEEDDHMEGAIPPAKLSKQPQHPAPPIQRQKAPAQPKVPTKQPQPPRVEKPPPPSKAKGKAPTASVPPPSSSIPNKPPPPPPVHPLPPKPKLAPAPAAPPPAAQTKAPKKRDGELAHVSDAEEEVLEFGRPAQPAKKRSRKVSSAHTTTTAAVAPVPLPSSGLALPGTSSSVAPPPPIPTVASGANKPLLTVTSATPEAGSESEEEWDEVDPEPLPDDDFFGDNGEEQVQGEEEEEQGEDIDVDEFEQQMNMEMEEIGEDEDASMMMDQEMDVPIGGPMSLNDYARGVVGISDDETTSSEDSDDD